MRAFSLRQAVPALKHAPVVESQREQEMVLHGISELARGWHIAPRIISDLFYNRHLDESRVVFVGGRRVIPNDYVAEIRAKLVELGKLPVEELEVT